MWLGTVVHVCNLSLAAQWPVSLAQGVREGEKEREEGRIPER